MALMALTYINILIRAPKPRTDAFSLWADMGNELAA
jgi:hypothetical protein